MILFFVDWSEKPRNANVLWENDYGLMLVVESVIGSIPVLFREYPVMALYSR